jgi:type IV pilus assembly protein PilV
MNHSSTLGIRATLHRGMSLVEVLVTVVLISVGLLGVAALQVTSLKGNQESYARSQATSLASDIIERMRANQLGLAAYQTGLNGVGSGNIRAVADLTGWQQSIDRILPGGAVNSGGSVAVNGNIVTVTIQWLERAEGANAQTRAVGTPITFSTRSEI